MTTPWQQVLTSQPRIAGFLRQLVANPPTALLLEGGTASERLNVALFWAARLMCRETHAPCGHCRQCLQVMDDTSRNVVLLTGAEKGFSIDSIREVRALLGDATAGQGPRVIILAEAQDMDAAAGNALLKSLEEPQPGNLFVLLVPNRDVLLPTLVSRSFVLTLGWSRSEEETTPREWIAALSEFLQTGKGVWLEWTGKKGAVDAALAAGILQDVQRALVQVGYGNPTTELARSLTGRLDVVAVRQVGIVVENALESLNVGTNATTVLEWTAMRIWNLLHK